jgi:hypothetical protein
VRRRIPPALTRQAGPGGPTASRTGRSGAAGDRPRSGVVAAKASHSGVAWLGCHPACPAPVPRKATAPGRRCRRLAAARGKLFLPRLCAAQGPGLLIFFFGSPPSSRGDDRLCSRARGGGTITRCDYGIPFVFRRRIKKDVASVTGGDSRCGVQKKKKKPAKSRGRCSAARAEMIRRRDRRPDGAPRNTGGHAPGRAAGRSITRARHHELATSHPCDPAGLRSLALSVAAAAQGSRSVGVAARVLSVASRTRRGASFCRWPDASDFQAPMSTARQVTKRRVLSHA